jgi:hypothetical protein
MMDVSLLLLMGLFNLVAFATKVLIVAVIGLFSAEWLFRLWKKKP